MEDLNLSDIDRVDLDILKILSEDGRVAFNKIAEELKKSPVTIEKHVLDMEKKFKRLIMIFLNKNIKLRLNFHLNSKIDT